MKILYMIAAAGLLTTAALAAPPRPAAGSGRGMELYQTIGCAQCHGHAGQGGFAGPRLAGKPYDISMFARQLRHPVDDMPPYTAAVLSDADLALVHDYVVSLKP